MKRKKYPIHSDFKIWSHLNPPLDSFSVFCIQKLMSPLFNMEKSNDTCYVEKRIIHTKAHRIPILMYTPIDLSQQESPCLILYHGGGFVLPASLHHYKLARQYAIKAGCRVVFVNYSLAPRHSFPQAIFECFKVYEWLLNHAKELNIDASKIGVGGDSAGGQLASDVCISAKRKDIALPCLQMLIYPACTNGVETESIKEFIDTPMCNTKDMNRYLELYLKNNTVVHPEYLNLVEANLTNMPPTYIEIAEFDCLRDGALLFAEELTKNNVQICIHSTKGTIHGYDISLSSPIVKESISKRIDFLKTHLK